MTLIELRSTCAQIASSYMVLAKDPEDAGIEVACANIAERIQAIPLPEQEVNRQLLHADGENLAVRSFLMFYSCDTSRKISEMAEHMALSGWSYEKYCPDCLKDFREDHLTKADAQLWIRHLFSLEE